MLILCSDGLTSQHLSDRMRSITHCCHTAALVVTADPIYKEKNYHVPRCIRELQSLGLSVDIVDLDKDSPETLNDYDVVEFIGGNPYYLLNAIQASKSPEILKEIAQNKVLIGWSAAAFVFGPTLALVDKYSPEMNELGLTDLSGLSLTNHHLLPHYSKFLTRFDRFEEICQEYETEHHVSVIRLNDGDGLIISENTAELCKA